VLPCLFDNGASYTRVQGEGPFLHTPATMVGIKKPTQKTPPKKTQKPTLKKPTKNGFWGFLNFLFFMKIIQTFLFQTDFL
jgi:hypothetical protein